MYYLGMTIALRFLRFIVSQTKVNVKIVLWNQHNQIQSNSSDERGWECKNTRNSFSKSYHISYSKLEGKVAAKENVRKSSHLVLFPMQCFEKYKVNDL